MGFDGEVVVYHDEHVVIGTVNHGYACLGLTEVHCAAMVLRVIGKEHQRGSRKGEDFGPWFAEPSNNKLDQAAARQIQQSKTITKLSLLARSTPLQIRLPAL